jgi:hypothetical protein
LINETISLAKKGEPLNQKQLAQDPSEKLIEVHVAALKWQMQSRTFEMTADKLRTLQAQSVSLLELLKTNLSEKSGEASAWKFEKERSILCAQGAQAHPVRMVREFQYPGARALLHSLLQKKWQPAPTIRTYFCAS